MTLSSPPHVFRQTSEVYTPLESGIAVFLIKKRVYRYGLFFCLYFTFYHYARESRWRMSWWVVETESDSYSLDIGGLTSESLALIVYSIFYVLLFELYFLVFLTWSSVIDITNECYWMFCPTVPWQQTSDGLSFLYVHNFCFPPPLFFNFPF